MRWKKNCSGRVCSRCQTSGSVTRPPSPAVLAPNPNLETPGTTAHHARTTLRWLTPLRLQHQGKPIFKPHMLDATTLVRALLRRQLQWQQIIQHTEPPPQSQPLQECNADLQAASQCTLETHHMHWHDLQRHSGTQDRKLPLGGLIGSAQLRGPAPALHQLQGLLQLGEQIHIGKETVMGLGRYQLGPIEPA